MQNTSDDKLSIKCWILMFISADITIKYLIGFFNIFRMDCFYVHTKKATMMLR